MRELYPNLRKRSQRDGCAVKELCHRSRRVERSELLKALPAHLLSLRVLTTSWARRLPSAAEGRRERRFDVDLTGEADRGDQLRGQSRLPVTLVQRVEDCTGSNPGASR